VSFKRIIATALVVAAVSPLATAPAQPMRDPAALAHRLAVVHHSHNSGTTPQSITFTNPLGRSRGPGAGAGLL
jgi:hypothetical protein